MVCTTPSPLQCGQAPYGELNEKVLGDGSSYEIPFSVSIRCLLYCWMVSLSCSCTNKSPLPKCSAFCKLRLSLVRLSSFTTSLSTTSSILCTLYLSSCIFGRRSSILLSILTFT